MAYVHRTDPELRRALERWIGAEQEAMTRLEAVRLAAEIGRLAHEVLDQRVLEARSLNDSWAHIAAAVGITRQSAHKRWRHLEEPARARWPRSTKPASARRGGRPTRRGPAGTMVGTVWFMIGKQVPVQLDDQLVARLDVVAEPEA